MIKLHDVYFVGALIALSNAGEDYAKAVAGILGVFHLFKLFASLREK